MLCISLLCERDFPNSTPLEAEGLVVVVALAVVGYEPRLSLFVLSLEDMVVNAPLSITCRGAMNVDVTDFPP